MPLDAHLLSKYYDRVFPFNSLFKWLTAGQISADSECFAKREFAIVMAKGEDDIYMRWNSFKTPQAWRAKVLGLEITPHKMDIGAVYSIPVREKENFQHAFRAESRELVFDIDMDDYDEIRTCCSGKSVCKKCWRFLSLAMKLLTVSMKEDFGFYELLWIFSGRRGLHCWISDPVAVSLSSEARASLVDYLNLVTGSSMQKKKVNLSNRQGVHPMAKRAYGIALADFPDLLEEQKIFDYKSPHIDAVMAYLPPRTAKSLKEQADAEWTSGLSVDFWNMLKRHVADNDPGSPCLAEIVLAYSYPRLDVNVSKDISHLLKSPFCIHQATGRVCVPIIPSEADAFDPQAVPTLQEVVQEHRDSDTNPLSKYLHYFEKVHVPAVYERRREVKREDAEMATAW